MSLFQLEQEILKPSERILDDPHDLIAEVETRDLEERLLAKRLQTKKPRHKRPSVTANAIPWQGYKDLMNLHNLLNRFYWRHWNDNHQRETFSNFFKASFLFGSRRNETLGIKKSMMSIQEDHGREYVYCVGFPLEKAKQRIIRKGKLIKAYTEEEMIQKRIRSPFSFPLDESQFAEEEGVNIGFHWAEEFLAWTEKRPEELFYDLNWQGIDTRFRLAMRALQVWRDNPQIKIKFGEVDKLYSDAFNHRETAELCFPHGLRSMRASNLVSKHNYSMELLMAFFSWKSDRVARLYAQPSALDMIKQSRRALRDLEEDY